MIFTRKSFKPEGLPHTFGGLLFGRDGKSEPNEGKSSSFKIFVAGSLVKTSFSSDVATDFMSYDDVNKLSPSFKLKNK